MNDKPETEKKTKEFPDSPTVLQGKMLINQICEQAVTIEKK